MAAKKRAAKKIIPVKKRVLTKPKPKPQQVPRQRKRLSKKPVPAKKPLIRRNPPGRVQKSRLRPKRTSPVKVHRKRRTPPKLTTRTKPTKLISPQLIQKAVSPQTVNDNFLFGPSIPPTPPKPTTPQRQKPAWSIFQKPTTPVPVQTQPAAPIYTLQRPTVPAPIQTQPVLSLPKPVAANSPLQKPQHFVPVSLPKPQAPPSAKPVANKPLSAPPSAKFVATQSLSLSAPKSFTYKPPSAPLAPKPFAYKPPSAPLSAKPFAYKPLSAPLAPKSAEFVASKSLSLSAPRAPKSEKQSKKVISEPLETSAAQEDTFGVVNQESVMSMHVPTDASECDVPNTPSGTVFSKINSLIGKVIVDLYDPPYPDSCGYVNNMSKVIISNIPPDNEAQYLSVFDQFVGDAEMHMRKMYSLNVPGLYIDDFPFLILHSILLVVTNPKYKSQSDKTTIHNYLRETLDLLVDLNSIKLESDVFEKKHSAWFGWIGGTSLRESIFSKIRSGVPIDYVTGGLRRAVSESGGDPDQIYEKFLKYSTFSPEDNLVLGKKTANSMTKVSPKTEVQTEEVPSPQQTLSPPTPPAEAKMSPSPVEVKVIKTFSIPKPENPGLIDQHFLGSLSSLANAEKACISTFQKLSVLPFMKGYLQVITSVAEKYNTSDLNGLCVAMYRAISIPITKGFRPIAVPLTSFISKNIDSKDSLGILYTIFIAVQKASVDITDSLLDSLLDALLTINAQPGKDGSMPAAVVSALVKYNNFKSIVSALNKSKSTAEFNELLYPGILVCLYRTRQEKTKDYPTGEGKCNQEITDAEVAKTFPLLSQRLLYYRKLHCRHTVEKVFIPMIKNVRRFNITDSVLADIIQNKARVSHTLAIMALELTIVHCIKTGDTNFDKAFLEILDTLIAMNELSRKIPEDVRKETYNTSGQTLADLFAQLLFGYRADSRGVLDILQDALNAPDRFKGIILERVAAQKKLSNSKVGRRVSTLVSKVVGGRRRKY